MGLIGRILILLLLSGIIAWVGDRVGQYFGRRKATLFGLRPRTTSRLIAILTGILVMAASVFFISLIDSNFREAFVNLEKIQEENRRAEEELERSSREIAGLRDQENRARKNLEEVRGELEESREENSSLIEENYRLSEGNMELREEYESLSSVNESLVKENSDLRVEREALEKARNDLRAEIEARTSEDPLYVAGQFVSRAVFGLETHSDGEVPGPTDRESLEAEFRRQVDIELARFGASDAVQAFERIVPPPEGEIADAVDQLLLMLAAGENDLREIILDLISRRTVLRGDPLELGIDIHLNFEVFPEGKVIVLRQLTEETVADEGRLRKLVWDMYEEAGKVGAEQGILPSTEGGVVAVSNLAVEEYLNILFERGEPGVLSLVTRAAIKRNSLLSGANLILEFQPYQPEVE